MKRRRLAWGCIWKRAARLTLGALVVGGGTGAVGCHSDIHENEPRTTNIHIERFTQSSLDKIDLLLAIDNSRSMSDKQQILAAAVPDLVEGLVNPKCLDPKTGTPQPTQPAGPTEACDTGYQREFDPVLDIHVGIISSSLGGHGSDQCVVTDETNAPYDDKAHLLSRKADGGGTPIPGSTIETYLDKGFLAWDPEQKLKTYDEAGNATSAPGEADIHVDDENKVDIDGNGTPDTPDANTTALVPQLTDLVRGVGQNGCGFEAQLESVYRFLVDPEPYQTITVKDGVATPEGTDDALIQQRADFMRPDSLLAIITLTDENDCSMREGGQYYYGTQSSHLPAARSICATDPNNECCRSCRQDSTDCPDDPTCKNTDGSWRYLTALEDHNNLRCFDQKRRFGIDFLYPIDRYKKGLTEPTIQNRAGDVVPNPIFSDLNPNDNDSHIRDKGLVLFAGIVGVPWQDIARQNAAGEPDLLTGLDKDGNAVGGFKNATELLDVYKTGETASTWDVLLGNPATYVPPRDPLMIESIQPRSGTNPITGDAIAPVNADPGTNPINGHEWTISDNGDLQYACIFALPTEAVRDCADPDYTSCDCRNPTSMNPLCEVPEEGTNPTLQVRAKAYPGIRELQVIKAVETQGIVGSVCPKQVNAPEAADYGYRPAIGAIIDRLKPVIDGGCFPHTLTPDPTTGEVPCLILEARDADSDGEEYDSETVCNCNTPGRQDVSRDHEAFKKAVLCDLETDPSCTRDPAWDCVCELVQIPNRTDTIDDTAERQACQYSLDEPVVTADNQPVDGWCYIDATTTPPTGDPALVKKCPETEKHNLRFVGKGEAKPGATLFLACTDE